MTTKQIRNLENPKGIGTVYRDELPIAKVRYTLSVKQEIHVVRTFGGISEVDGLKSAQGSLSVVEGEEWLMGTDDPLVLGLEDGRHIKFFAVQHNHLGNMYRIVATGGWLGSD